MKRNIYALILLLFAFLWGGHTYAIEQQAGAEKNKLTAKERKKMIEEKAAERKRLQKERLAIAKQKKKEKLLSQKQKLKEKKEQQKETLRLRKEKIALKKSGHKPTNVAKDDKTNAETKIESSKPVENAVAVQQAKPELQKKQEKPSSPSVVIANSESANKLAKEADPKLVSTNSPKEETLKAKVNDFSTKVSRDSIRAAKRQQARIVALPYDVPTHNMQHENFVKYGKLHQFKVKGINKYLYDVFVNGDNYTESLDFDTSIGRLYDNVKSQPLESKKTNLNVSLIANEPWLSFFKAEDYRSALPPSAYSNYINKFNEIKKELKKEALSYKDFVGVLEVGDKNRHLPMQYELLDTTFYKSYYLLFVSRVDLLKDYHNAFVNQAANLDTVRYAELVRYKKKVEKEIRVFVDAKKTIDLALDTLLTYVRSLDEFYKVAFTDPVAYEGAELETQKKRFLTAFNLPETLDSGGMAEVRSAIRAKVLAQKKRIISSLAIAGDAYKSLEAYILQSRDYVDIYHRKYQDAIKSLDKMDEFVNKELSLQDRNIRLSEIVENLYRRLMLEYEVMRNQVKDNIGNMDAKVNTYGAFLTGNMSYERIRNDYESLRNTLGLYLQDDVYDKLALLVEKIFVNTNDANNFSVEAKVARIRTTDFVDYNLLVQPKKNLPKHMVTKFTTIRESFRFPVYGGFLHTVGLSLGTNLSFVPSYKLNPNDNNSGDSYTIVQDGSSTKAKLHLSVAYNFLYRTKNPNFRYGGNAGLLLDLSNLLYLGNTKVLLGPALQFYDRLLLSVGITLGAEPTLKSEYKPNQNISIRTNLNGNPNNIIQQLHNNKFAVGLYFSAGISLF